MLNINAPPIIKQEDLKVTAGIDSVHVLIQMNKFDLKRFCVNGRYVCKAKKVLTYQCKWFIFLADGEPITATYHFKSRTIKFQIGKLLNYSINHNRYELVQQLFTYFSDRKISIGKIDIAVDINKKRDDLIVKNLSKIVSKKRVKSTTYDNAKGHVFIAYDKSNQLEIYSTDLSRLELRLNTQLRSWKVNDFMNNKHSFDKLVKMIDEYFRDKVKVYSNDGLTQYALNIDVDSVLTSFIAFAHGDTYKYKDHFRIKEAVEKRDKFFTWMKANKLTPKKINRFVKGRRAAICKELGLDSKTFKKAVDFYKAIPNFKFKK